MPKKQPTRAELLAEIDRLAEELAKPFELRLADFSADMRGINATFEHPLIESVSEAMMRFFQEMGGTNLLETKCEIRFSGELNGRREMFTYTLQRVGGLTPMDKVALAEARAEAAERALRVLVDSQQAVAGPVETGGTGEGGEDA
jgi:hypothetical protein